jgi:hypothetical protein
LPDFEPLTETEARAFDRFERMRDWGLRLHLVRHAARARIRVAEAVSSGLEPITRTRTKKLATLARRIAGGYDRLATLDGAVRFCALQVERTAALAKVALRK